MRRRWMLAPLEAVHAARPPLDCRRLRDQSTVRPRQSPLFNLYRHASVDLFRVTLVQVVVVHMAR